MSHRDELGRVLCSHGRPIMCDECGEEYAVEIDRGSEMATKRQLKEARRGKKEEAQGCQVRATSDVRTAVIGEPIVVTCEQCDGLGVTPKTRVPGTYLVVCEHQIVPQDCPYCELKRLRAQCDELTTACEFAFAFVDSIEWTDNTSATQAENVKEVLQRAITATEGR